MFFFFFPGATQAITSWNGHDAYKARNVFKNKCSEWFLWDVNGGVVCSGISYCCCFGSLMLLDVFLFFFPACFLISLMSAFLDLRIFKMLRLMLCIQDTGKSVGLSQPGPQPSTLPSGSNLYVCVCTLVCGFSCLPLRLYVHERTPERTFLQKAALELIMTDMRSFPALPCLTAT